MTWKRGAVIGNIDTEAIKARVDLRGLAGGRVELRSEAGGGREQSGPCPKCGGEDRLHVTQDWFMCRQCHPKRGDALEFVQWLGLAADFRAACEYLAGPAPLPTSGGPVIKAAPAHKSGLGLRGWQDASWQAEARADLSRAQATLAGPEGEEGRAYLAGRGLTPETWRAWGLGFTRAAWDPKLRASRAAVVIPWQRDKITALKYRFLTVPDGGLRYTSKGGGQCLAFGLGLAGRHFSTLWLCEGELNALALWQSLSDRRAVNWDVVSFGAEGNALNATVSALAAQYLQVIVWTDEPDKAAAAMAAIPGAFGLRSPNVNGQKLDANDLLRLGKLGDFTKATQARFDAAPAFVAKLRAAIGEGNHERALAEIYGAA